MDIIELCTILITTVVCMYVYFGQICFYLSVVTILLLF